MTDPVDRLLAFAMAEAVRQAPSPPPWPGEPARRRSAPLLAAAAFALLVALGGLVYLVARTAPSPEPATAGPAVASWPAGDGTLLRGDLYPGDEPAGIVLAGAYGAPADELEPIAEPLAARGHSVLVPDLRGEGRSDGVVDVGLAPGDLGAAVAYLASTGVDEVWLAGYLHSGAAAAELAAADPGLVDGLILLYPLERYLGLDTTAALAVVDVPVLLVGASPAVFRAAPPGREHVELGARDSVDFVHAGDELAEAIATFVTRSP